MCQGVSLRDVALMLNIDHKLQCDVPGKRAMNCAFCGGELKKSTVTFSYEEDETYILVEHVPAEVCAKCGERLYAPEVTDTLLQFANTQ